ncbi:hypothetical protein LY78DRAFT_656792 [Colletotrichum sublineola]|nr:hypothetical protein LY78DRAFT_656792 [Colletotrichum sublineola]
MAHPPTAADDYDHSIALFRRQNTIPERRLALAIAYCIPYLFPSPYLFLLGSSSQFSF